MSLPDRKSDDAGPKAGIRPRTMPLSESARETLALLHFACPACLRMMAAEAGARSAGCPECGATVAPPKVIAAAAPRIHSVQHQMPPPKKTGVMK